MAETIIAIGTAVSSAVSTAGTAVSSMFAGSAAAGTGAAASGAAASGTTALGGFASTVSTALSIGSAISSIAAGNAAATATQEQARQVRVQDAQSRAQGAQRRATIAEEYADLVSEQTAVQLANGLNPNVGTPKNVRNATREFAERNLATSRENTLNRSRVARLQQRSLMRSANAQRIGGFVQAGQTGANALQAVG
jgi:hypothetical protein